MSARPSRRAFLKSGASIAVGAPALLSSAAFAQDPTATDAELTRVEAARRIWQVDDLEENRQVFSGLLQPIGCEVLLAPSGEEAIEVFAAHQPDIVFMDIRMPGIDGVEAGCQIRAMDPEVEIIFVTGFSDVPLAELQRRVPPPIKLHYFNKPLSFTQLAHDVASMVRTH